METRTCVLGFLVLMVLAMDIDPTECQPLSSGGCPTSWFPIRSTSQRTRCAWISTDKERWINAMGWCRLLGGHLLEIKSHDTNRVISDFIRSRNSGKYWIGLADAESENLFRWMASGVYSNLATSFFKPGSSRSGNQKNCVAMEGNGFWLDEACSAEFWFVCEKSV